MNKLLFKRGALLVLIVFSLTGCFLKKHQNQLTSGAPQALKTQTAQSNRDYSGDKGQSVQDNQSFALSDVWYQIISNEDSSALEPKAIAQLEDEDTWLLSRLDYPEHINFDDLVILDHLQTLIQGYFTDESSIRDALELSRTPMNTLKKNLTKPHFINGGLNSPFFQEVKQAKRDNAVDISLFSDLEETDKIILLYLIVDQSKGWEKEEEKKAFDVLDKVFRDDVVVNHQSISLRHLKDFWELGTGWR